MLHYCFRLRLSSRLRRQRIAEKLVCDNVPLAHCRFPLRGLLLGSRLLNRLRYKLGSRGRRFVNGLGLIYGEHTKYIVVCKLLDRYRCGGRLRLSRLLRLGYVDRFKPGSRHRLDDRLGHGDLFRLRNLLHRLWSCADWAALDSLQSGGNIVENRGRLRHVRLRLFLLFGS